MAPLLTARKQLFCLLKAGTGNFGVVGSGSANVNNVVAGANAILDAEECEITYDIQRTERNPQRPQTGQVTALHGSVSAQVSCTIRARGSGVAGVPPSFAKLLRGCNLLETILDGTAAIGAVSAVKASGATDSAKPTTGGTYTGTKSGRVEIVITALTLNTSITFQATFYPGDGTANLTASFTQDSGSAITLTGVAAGVTVDFGDPSASTAGFAVGQKFRFGVTSDQAVEVQYTPRETNLNVYLDFALIEDGRMKAAANCQGTFTLDGVRGEYLTLVFTFSGVKFDPEDKAFVTADLAIDDQMPEAFVGATVEYDSAALACIANFSFDQGNNVIIRECAQNAEGFISGQYVSRAPSGSVDPEAVLTATFDPFALAFSGEENSFTVAFGSAGNRIAFSARFAQLSGAPETGDRDGILTDTLNFAWNQPLLDDDSDYTDYSLIFS